MPPRRPLHETRPDAFGGPLHVHARKLRGRIGAWDSPENLADELAQRQSSRPNHPRHPSHIASPYSADLPYATSTRGLPAFLSRQRPAAELAFERAYRGEDPISDEEKDV
jgi:hypothetical protein